MTVCNMSIEAGARAGMIAPDQTTFDYLRGRPFAPAGAAWDKAVERWRKLPTDPGAKYDKSLVFDAANIAPQVTWGTNPGQVAAITSKIPKPADYSDPTDQKTTAEGVLQTTLLFVEYENPNALDGDVQPNYCSSEVTVDFRFTGSFDAA